MSVSSWTWDWGEAGTYWLCGCSPCTRRTTSSVWQLCHCTKPHIPPPHTQSSLSHATTVCPKCHHALYVCYVLSHTQIAYIHMHIAQWFSVSQWLSNPTPRPIIYIPQPISWPGPSRGIDLTKIYITHQCLLTHRYINNKQSIAEITPHDFADSQEMDLLKNSGMHM